MKAFVHQIKPEGVVFKQTFPVEATGLTEADDIRFIRPVAVTADVFKAEDELIANVMAQTRYESFCGRCLETVQRDWGTTFTLVFDIDGKTEFVEMDEDIRQELILNLPVRVVCCEACKGLCAECGANLNTTECSHKKAKVNA